MGNNIKAIKATNILKSRECELVLAMRSLKEDVRTRGMKISVEIDLEAVKLIGKTKTFYEKQIAQTVMMQFLQGTKRLLNDIKVQ